MNINDMSDFDTFLNATEQYLVVTACCVGTKIKPNLEPTFSKFCEKFPYANIYPKRDSSTTKDRPGTIKVVGNGKDQRLIIVCFSQYYVGRNNLPNDSREQRLGWFKKCLEKISQLQGLQSVAFLEEQINDCGGSVEAYKQAILDLQQYVKLVSPNITVKTYGVLESRSEQLPIFEKKIIGLNALQQRSFRIEQLVVIEPVSQNEFKKPESVPEESEECRNVVSVFRDLSNKSRETVSKISVKTRVKKAERKYAENPDWKPLNELPRHPSWNKIFEDIEIKKSLDELDIFFQKELEDFGDDVAILPSSEAIFRVFQDPLDNVKVVILGQDPYHSNKDEAMGLAFSVPRETPIPPSLKNIYKELSNDIDGFEPPSHGDLSKWATQGVLLLNTALTVRQKKPGAHLKEWQRFTDRIISLLASDQENPKVFLLWGAPAQKKTDLIRTANCSEGTSHNKILTAVHPSPLSANRGWFGSGHFSKTNEILQEWKKEPIDWKLS